MDKKNCLLYLHVQPETGVHISDLSHQLIDVILVVFYYGWVWLWLWADSYGQ